jgi:hypothetical protein
VVQAAVLRSPTPPPRIKIDGQNDGYWVEPPDEVASVRPAYDPTGALLIADALNDDGTRSALSLVRRSDGTFGPVSHAAVLTYLHTTGMEDGETWHFAVYEGERLVTVFECIPPLDEASQREVADCFGPEAGNRARDDYPTIVFRVRQVDGQGA